MCNFLKRTWAEVSLDNISHNFNDIKAGLSDGVKIMSVVKADAYGHGVRYIGWDVCITPDGPVLIEGNDYPGYDFWQLPEHTPDKIGLLPYYKKMVPELK